MSYLEPIKPREPVEIEIKNLDKEVYKRIIEATWKNFPEVLITTADYDKEKDIASIKIIILC